MDKFCLFELMDKAMDTLRKKHLEMKEPPSLKNIVAIFRKTSAGSTYRRYALQSILCIFTQEASIKNESIHDPIRDVLKPRVIYQMTLSNS